MVTIMKESKTGMHERCRECGGELALYGYKHTEKVGRWTVTDASSMAWQCRKCGTPIRSTQSGIDARLTYWCPACQSEA